MADLNVIQDGAVLIRNGCIEHVGTTRQVENLVPARQAREIDATGKVVMPAFVDPDIALTAPSGSVRTGGDSYETDIRRMSWRRMVGQTAAVAADLARYGVLNVGANTSFAPDLQSTSKALRLYQAMHSRPLRIRSIFAPPIETGRQISEKWLVAIIRKKLASILEISVASGQIEDARSLASAAAAAGFNIRLRATGPTTAADVLELAYSSGAIALVGPVPGPSAISRTLADVGCVAVVSASGILSGNYSSKRSAIDDGTPVALASGYRQDCTASLNPQFLLYLACGAPGMTVEEAIVAATYNAACSLRLSHVIGSLGPGKFADLCVMDVDDYHELARRAGHHDVYLVMRGGKIVYQRANLALD